MKRLSRSNGYAHNMHVVELSNEEMQYSNAKLLHMVDNGYRVQEWWPEVEAGSRHPGHWGGVVTKHPDNTATIKVYID